MSVCLDIQVCKGCGLCVAGCPKGVLELSEKRNAKGANYAEQVRPQDCIDCAMCQDICPDLAIWVCSEEETA